MFAYLWVDGEETEDPTGKRGDVNMDSLINVADVTALIQYVLSNDATGISVDNAECDQQDGINVSDVTALIQYVLNSQW